MEMNEIIKALRNENKLTQEELAQKLGIQKSAVAKYESGRVENIKRSTIQKMAEIFGVEPSYVLGWGERKDNNAMSFEKRLISYADKLNDIGKKKLLERAEELTYIPKYQKQEEILEAAHERTDIEVTDEMRKHDDDLMRNDDLWDK